MTDLYEGTSPGLTSPAIDGENVTPSDSAALNNVTRAVYVGSGGALRAEFISGREVTFQALPTGAILPLRVSRIFATGTTASGLVALW